MVFTKLEKICKYGLIVLGVTPLIASNYFIFPFVHLKSIFFRVVMLLLILLISVVILGKGRWRGRGNYVFYSWLIFLASQMFAAIFGTDVYRSMWGNFERMEGGWQLLLIGVYFFCLINFLKNKIDWLWLWRVFLFTSVAVGILGLIKNGLAIANNDWSTLGNSAYLGVYMMMAVFAAALMFYLNENRYWRGFYLAAGIFYFLILLGSASRAPILGLIIGLFIGGAVYYKKFRAKWKIFFLIVIAMIFVLGGMVFWQRDSSFVQVTPFLRRISHISLNDTSTNNRLLVWQGGLHAFLDRPILGYGPENFATGLNKHYNPAISENWFDRAHNFFIELLATSGILGFLAFAFFIFFVFKDIIKIFSKDRMLAAIFFAFIVAYSVVALLLFNNLLIYLPLIGAAATIGFFKNELFASEEEGAVSSFLIKMKYIICGVVVLIVLVGFNAMVIKPVRANLNMANSIRYAVVDKERALDYYRKALALGSYGSREITLQLSQSTVEMISSSEFENKDKKIFFEEAESRMKKILENKPGDFQTRIIFGQLYVTYALINPYYAQQAIELLKNNISDSSGHVDIYFLLAQAHWIENDKATAVKYLEEAYAVAPRDQQVLENLMNMYAQAGEKEKILKIGKEYLEIFKQLKSEKYRKVGEYYYVANLVDESEKVLISYAIPADVNYWRNYVSLASIYEGRGQLAEAIKILEQALNSHNGWPIDVRQTINDYMDSLKSVI